MPFLHMANLTRQVKSAYNVDRLKVAYLTAPDGESSFIVIQTTHCTIAVKTIEVPNKMKAIITEFIGFVPHEDGMAIEAGKDVADRDLIPEEITALRLLVFPGLAKYRSPYMIAPVSITERGSVRLIQEVSTNTCTGIRQEFLDLITYANLDYAVEGEPTGPEVDGEGMAYFTNATTILVLSTFGFSGEKNKEILGLLQLLELREDK